MGVARIDKSFLNEKQWHCLVVLWVLDISSNGRYQSKIWIHIKLSAYSYFYRGSDPIKWAIDKFNALDHENLPVNLHGIIVIDKEEFDNTSMKGTRQLETSILLLWNVLRDWTRRPGRNNISAAPNMFSEVTNTSELTVTGNSLRSPQKKSVSSAKWENLVLDAENTSPITRDEVVDC